VGFVFVKRFDGIETEKRRKKLEFEAIEETGN
jgi:hypothetical protein